MHVWQGLCITGGMHGGRGHAWWWGAYIVVGGMRSRRDGHCSGWYASYWNAFLFVCKFLLTYHKTSIMTPTHLFAGIVIPPVRVKTLKVQQLDDNFYLSGFKTFEGSPLLPTARKGNVFTRICDSVHNQPHGYSVTAHPCWLLGHSLLWRGRYACDWNAFLFIRSVNYFVE